MTKGILETCTMLRVGIVVKDIETTAKNMPIF